MAFAVSVAIFWALVASISVLVTPVWLEGVSFLGILPILCGIVTMLIAGVVVDRTHTYMEILFFALLVAGLSLLLFARALHSTHNHLTLVLSLTSFGASLSVIPTIGVECAVELAYDTKNPREQVLPSFVAGVLYTLTNMIAMPILLLAPLTPAVVFVLFCAGLLLFAAVALGVCRLIRKPIYYRIEHDRMPIIDEPRNRPTSDR